MDMNSSPHRRENELRANLLGLAKDCPFHQSNPEDCPLFSLRRMKPTKRRQWFRALSEADLRYLATYHHICLRIKMESRLTEEDGRAARTRE